MPIILYIMLILGLIFPSPLLSQVSSKGIKKGDNEPLVIRSNRLEIDNKKQIVVFTGNVDARKSNFTINCRKLRLFYFGQPTGKDLKEDDIKVDRIIATGDVKIKRLDGGLAMADKGVYYQSDEKVVLTGNPVVKQGNDFVEGSRITFFLKEKRSIVESSKHKKVRAVLFPRSKKR